MSVSKCSFVECDECHNLSNNGSCEFHSNGGNLGSGETYEQYQIIENDFINYIRYVPLNEQNHLKVHSPILRDIILRSCVQIEQFLKEWALFFCSEYQTYPPFFEEKIWKDYNSKNKKDEIQKTRNWSIGTYYTLKVNYFKDEYLIFIRPMNKCINPFADWNDEKNPPNWWNAYNTIKHGGKTAKSLSNLENALLSLSALFYLHCVNEFSRKSLERFSTFHVNKKFDKIELEYDSIKSPIDMKNYLFRFEENYPNKKIDLSSNNESRRNRSWVK